MTEQDQLYAKYRLARIAGKQNKYGEAEKLYLELRRGKSELYKPYPRAVLQDLASLEIKFKTEQQVLDFSRTVLKLSSDDETVFLRDAMQAQKEDAKGSGGVFMARISTLTKDPVEKIRLGLHAIEQQRRDSANKDMSFELGGLLREIHALTPAGQKAVFAELNSELRVELEHSIALLAERFAALVKTKAGVAQLRDPGAKLLAQLAFLEDNIQSENRVKAIKLWIDVCASLKQMECVVERAQKILQNKEYVSLRDFALHEQLPALEELNKTNPERYHNQLR
jgi:hypothetical protein